MHWCKSWKFYYRIIILRIVGKFANYFKKYMPPRTFSTGIGTFSKNTSAVLEHLIPIFFSGGPLKSYEKVISEYIQRIIKIK